ncbi:MAG TPA: hypothetical protein VF722_10915 [Gemmatimonadaceae bacterium]
MRSTTLTLAALVLGISACAKGQSAAGAAADTTKAMAGAAADSMKGMSGMAMDTDKAMGGSGVPTGFTAETDKPDAKITDAKYTVSGDKWEVQTGPAHIVYAAKDSASGVYAVSATIEQLEKPKHPEAYGIFFGGQHLDDRATENYGYFLVRGTGEYLIKVRNGDKTSTVVNWKASADVPKEDASGKATYNLKVHFAPTEAHFYVNGKLVATEPRKDVPSNGIAGLRINHNLHVSVQPVTITK